MHFGPDGGGMVTFLVYPPDDLVLVVRSSGSAVSYVWVSWRLLPSGVGNALIGRKAVTFCSWHPMIAMVSVDRFVNRAIGANSAIRAIGGTTPWYPCS